MTDREKREKIINGLECCATNRLRREDCEAMGCVYLDLEGHGCIHQLIRDALALLKAQEPVEPKIIDTANSKLYHNDMFKNYYCGNCGEYLHVVNRKDMFCSQCGQAVKWDE